MVGAEHGELHRGDHALARLGVRQLRGPVLGPDGRHGPDPGEAASRGISRGVAEAVPLGDASGGVVLRLSLIHISEPTRR
eukprot:10545636-Lingulodinium_polyedra.AAC.1